MSYELGAAARGLRRRPIHFSNVGTPSLHVGRRIGGVVKPLPLRAHVLHGYERSDGLGFSLKPPRWIRKMQPGVYIRKHPLILAPLALAIPGAIPFVAHAAASGAGLLTKGVVGAGKLVSGAVTSLFRPKLPTTALKQALAMGTGAGATPIVATPPVITPDQIAVPTPAGEPAPMFTSSGGGGGAVSPIETTQDTSTPAAAGTAGPGMNPMVLIVGAGLLMVAAGAMRKRK